MLLYSTGTTILSTLNVHWPSRADGHFMIITNNETHNICFHIIKIVIIHNIIAINPKLFIIIIFLNVFIVLLLFCESKLHCFLIKRNTN